MSEAAPRERDARFDILKGIAILAVLVHHVTGFGLGSNWHGPDYQLNLEYVNRVVRFAVPTFILLSVFLVGRGLAHRVEFKWGPYLAKRFWGTVYPYLIWTLIYLGLHAFAGRHSSTLLAMGFKSTQPSAVLKTLGWIFGYGKASFHLYFLVALFQVQLLLPLLVRGGKRWLGDGLWKWLAVAIICQLAIYVLSHQIGAFYRAQGQEPPLPPFSSMFYGYLLPAILGVGLAVCVRRDPPEGSEPFPSGWIVWLLPVAIYVPYAFLDIHGSVVDGSPFLHSLPNLQEGLFMSYSTAAGVALLSLCGKIRGPVASVLTVLGTESLGIYLVHPIILELLRPHAATLGGLPVAELWVFLITLGATWLGLRILRVCRLDRILFGR